MDATLHQRAMGLAGMLFSRGGFSTENTFTTTQREGLHLLQEVKAVLPGPTQATDALCDYCGLYRGRVFRRHDGLTVQCPDCGPTLLDPANLRSWRLDDQWLIRKLRGALSIDASAPVTPVVEGVWDIGTHKRRPVLLGRKIDGVMWQALKIFHGHEPRRNSWVITPRPFGPAPMEPLAGTATWWHLEDRFAIHGLALRYVPLDAEQGGRVQEPGAAYAVHGPFTADFGMAMLDDWPHGPIRLSGAQSRLFAVLWKHRHQAQTAELLMREAGLASDRPLDLFKIKAANRGDPAYEGPLHAYERLVVRQRRLGLYQLAWTD